MVQRDGQHEQIEEIHLGGKFSVMQADALGQGYEDQLQCSDFVIHSNSNW